MQPREYSSVWRSHYNGSLLSHILSIPPKYTRYRNWLRGRVILDGQFSSPPSLSRSSSPDLLSPLNDDTSLIYTPVDF